MNLIHQLRVNIIDRDIGQKVGHRKRKATNNWRPKGDLVFLM